MHKREGNSTLAHSGDFMHVASYSFARLAQLVIGVDVAGPCAHHSNQVTAAFLSGVGRRVFWFSIFRVPAHNSQKNVTMSFRDLQSILEDLAPELLENSWVVANGMMRRLAATLLQGLQDLKSRRITK
jgi:hypothetical protein